MRVSSCGVDVVRWAAPDVETRSVQIVLRTGQTRATGAWAHTPLVGACLVGVLCWTLVPRETVVMVVAHQQGCRSSAAGGDGSR